MPLSTMRGQAPHNPQKQKTKGGSKKLKTEKTKTTEGENIPQWGSSSSEEVDMYFLVYKEAVFSKTMSIFPTASSLS